MIEKYREGDKQLDEELPLPITPQLILGLTPE